MFSKRRLWVVGAAALTFAIVAGSAGAVIATGGDDSEQRITGAALQEASRVALEHTGGGRVTGTEVGDEDSYYEVEVTLDGGGQVDVQLDENFNVVSQAEDDESAGD